MIKSKRYQWYLFGIKIIMIVIILVLNYIKAVGIGEEDKSIWRWVSIALSILAMLTTIGCEIMVFRYNFFKYKHLPQKNNSVDASPTNKKWPHPYLKESTVEIKQLDKSKIDLEKENMIKKIESFKTTKVLYILRNDLDVLPLPDQPFKRYSSHYSIGKSLWNNNWIDHTTDEVEGFLKNAIETSDNDSKRGSKERSKLFRNYTTNHDHSIKTTFYNPL